VTERSSQLAAKAERQLSDTVEFLAGLADSDLQTPCDDDRAGETIGAVAAHIAQGYGQASIFLRLKPATGSAGSPSRSGGFGALMGMAHGNFAQAPTATPSARMLTSLATAQERPPWRTQSSS
jgi:hypothetical protein